MPRFVVTMQGHVRSCANVCMRACAMRVRVYVHQCVCVCACARLGAPAKLASY